MPLFDARAPRIATSAAAAMPRSMTGAVRGARACCSVYAAAIFADCRFAFRQLRYFAVMLLSLMLICCARRYVLFTLDA